MPDDTQRRYDPCEAGHWWPEPGTVPPDRDVTCRECGAVLVPVLVPANTPKNLDGCR